MILIARRIDPGFTAYLPMTAFVRYSLIVYFDAAGSFGIMPVPGFPLMVALIRRLGAPPEATASVISILLRYARMYCAGLTNVVSYACACADHSPAFVGD